MTDLRHETLQPLCGAYLSGALPPADEADFERHLAGCPECMDECDRLGATASGLASLPRADIEDLLLAEPWPPITAATPPPPAALSSPAAAAASPTATAAAPTATAASPTAAAASRAPAVAATKPGPAAPPTASTRPPARSGDSRRPGRSRRRRLLGSVLAALVVAGLGVGVVVKMAQQPSAPAVQTDQVGSVSAEGTGAAARLAVTVDAKSQVRATVAGLTQGERYKLYAIDAAGTNHLVTQWTADADAERVVTGRTDVPLTDLAFFAVTHGAADSAVVSARVTR
ncbi:zf-HC2 domain-containing protein [Actinoplanes sp. NPDC026619]|uniref:anti-sigma factor family protein n=1 Tax=Actinoplanes sp. NPDC026619 TaxID=3155798 RepID=UPI0034099946